MQDDLSNFDTAISDELLERIRVKICSGMPCPAYGKCGKRSFAYAPN